MPKAPKKQKNRRLKKNKIAENIKKAMNDKILGKPKENKKETEK